LSGQLHGSDSVPELSVIVPTYNAAASIRFCLESLIRQATPNTEIIVVDDASSDGTCAIVSSYPVTLVSMDQNRGAGAARNRGVEISRGRILLFVDADVEAAPDVLSRALRDIKQPGVDAVIGSYDDAPFHRTTVSQFKNLAHHYFHQRAAGSATTFWGACGVIRRERFVAAGGFDDEIRGIEDVDLGYRLTAAGAAIRLDPLLQVKHHKQWTLASLVATDIRQRTLPWVLAWRKYGYLPQGLNFGTGQRLAAMLAIVLLLSAVASPFVHAAAVPLVLCLSAAAWVNRGLYRLFWRKGGLRLLTVGFLLQQFYYLYASAGLMFGLAASAKSARHTALATTDRAA